MPMRLFLAETSLGPHLIRQQLMLVEPCGKFLASIDMGNAFRNK